MRHTRLLNAAFAMFFGCAGISNAETAPKHSCYDTNVAAVAKGVMNSALRKYFKKEIFYARSARNEICAQIESDGKVTDGDIFFGIHFPNPVAAEINRKGVDFFPAFAALYDLYMKGQSPQTSSQR